MFTISEPHPTVQANAYTYAGRGGAGNTFRAPSDVTPAAGVPVALTKSATHASYSSAASATSSSSSSRFYAGRGGAGNACPAAERRRISLDDEYEYASAVSRATSSGHVGRGGAGNFYKTPTDVSWLASGGRSTSTTPAESVSTADRIAHALRKLSGSSRKGSNASDASTSSDSTSSRRSSGFFARR